MSTINKAEAGKDTSTMVKGIINKYGIFFVLLLMVIALSIMNENFLKIGNILNVIRQVSIITIIAYGITFIIITKGIDLSGGSVVALVTVVVASMAHPNQYPLIVPILAGLAVGCITGFFNGFLSAYFDIPPFISTLGMFSAAKGAALLYSDGKPIGDFTKSFEFIGGGSVAGIPVPIIILLVVGVIMHLLLNNTKFGKYTYAIGGNEHSAVISGINVKKYKVIIFMLGGVMVAIASIILAARVSSGAPSHGLGYELDAIASAVIGGTSLDGGIGSIPGTIVGGLIIGVLNNGMDLMGVSAYWQQILKGVIIVAAVILDKKKTKLK